MDATPADGTSQADRRWPELDPASAPVDERSTLDLLAFAGALAGELKFVDASGADGGDWRGLLPPAELLDEAVDCLADPGRIAPERAALYARPHVALLLAFVDLLGHARARLNDFGRRHLDYYYGQVLRMTRKRAVPDRVHVVVEPDARAVAVELGAGSPMNAGKDSAGVERVYRSESALVVRPVQVAALKSLRADIHRTGLREASLRYLIGGTRAEAFVGMLRIALGQPEPGGALATPICNGLPAVAGTPIAFDHLLAAHDRLRRVALELGMPLYDDYRRLIALRASRRQRDGAEWAQINAVLQAAGQARSRNPGFRLTVTQADDFVGNLRQALGIDAAAYARYYDGLPEVKSAEQAFAVLDDRPDVQAFVQTKLFLGLDAFRAMMSTKQDIDAEWAEIDALVEAALQVKTGNADALLADAQRRLRDVDALLAAALGFAPAEGLDGFHAAFLAIESWFCMSAERADYLMSVGRRAAAGDVDASTWDKVYALCAQAHEALVFRLRREALLAAAQPAIGANDAAKALAAMLQVVLAETLELPDALAALGALRLNPADAQYVDGVAHAGAAASTVDWPRLATALEVAQRNREQFTPPPAEQVVWRHLYAAADARAVLAPNVQEGELPRWKTFGSAAGAALADTPPPALIGWALASPLLALAEGTRTITLRLGCLAEGFDATRLRRLFAPAAPDSATAATVNPFAVQLSGAKGWVDAGCTIGWNSAAMDGYPTVTGVDTRALRMIVLTLHLDDKQPALVAPTLAVHGLDAAASVLRLMLRPAWNPQEAAWTTAYPELHTLRVARIALAVSVNGLSNLLLRNDQSVLDAKKPFEPFGTQPPAGSRLLIGHSELVSKPLDSLTLRFRWMGAPASFATQYTNYPGALGNASFSARVGLQDGNLFAPASAAMTFFDSGDTAAQITRTIALPADPGLASTAVTAGTDVGRWSRFLVWELAGDFQHAIYPTLALQNSLAMAGAVARGEKPADGKYLINPPYTPKLKYLVVDYSSSLESALASADPAALRALHWHPFGAAPAAAEVAPGVAGGVPDALPLLPAYDGEGMLYIGLARVQAPQALALLLQMAEGSADPDVAPEPVQWSVLDGDRWVSLHDGALLEDGTRGLINSGLVRFALPAVAPSTRLPAGLYWLRATVAHASDGVCDMVAIHPNAVVAVFVDQGNASDHLAAALPPGSITALAQPLPGVAKLTQPYSSFGGKPSEADADFDLRVSERLRHKQRALTPWDYERLVLERFPLLHKAKCLRPQADAAPGQVDLVVVPDIVGRFPFNPFEPKVPADVVRDIEAFLADKTPPFASVRVRNAFFVPLKVRCGVRFVPGIDEGLCRARLNDELNRFLSPWAYEEGADLVIGGAIYANSIIDFIDGRDYVDYIAELRLFVNQDGRDVLVPYGPDYHASAGRDDAVLVAARSHEFDVIAHADYRVDGFAGINYMKIELDFIVS